MSALEHHEVCGSVPERPKGAGCKPAGLAYGGSNPPRPTPLHISCTHHCMLACMSVNGTLAVYS